MYSNWYIFRFAVIMVTIVGIMLAGVSELLKPKQQANIRIEKMQDILKSAHIENTVENAEELYNKHVTKEVILDLQGNETDVYENGNFVTGDLRAFDVKLKEELSKIDKGDSDINLPLYVCQKDGKSFYIIPLLGKGLWGPIWGNIAFEEDLNTVEGAVFGHKSETPGLGAEIASYPIFQKQFEGKKIFNNEGTFASITVVKGGVEGSKTPVENGVDAISGGTITSDAVTKMLLNVLKNYEPYFKKHQ